MKNPELSLLALEEAVTALEEAVMRAILHSRYGDPAKPYYSAQLEHDEDAVALAARDLVKTINKLPAEQQPIGWNKADAR